MFLRLFFLRSINQLLGLLALVWLCTFIFYERYVPYSSARACSWPEVTFLASEEPAEDIVVVEQAVSEQDQKPVAPPPPQDGQNGRRDGEDGNDLVDGDNTNGEKYRETEFAHIMLIADPQLIDEHTYPGRNSLLLSLSQHTVDTYMKKSYKALGNHLSPEHVFFLGDYLDNGRSSDDSYFMSQLARFKKIFPKFASTYTYHTNLPGNHDIGFGDDVKVPSRDRFEEHFGLTNTVYEICDVQFITLDTISLSSSNKEINEKAKNFLNHLEGTTKETPRVLLSHVPFYRDPAKQKCGASRESSEFKLGSGYQYQNSLSEELSKEIIDKVEPDLIYSGDDHDYCDVLHDDDRVREITVKLISMAMGIKYPAVQLLTLVLEKESNQVHYETEICYLPTPYVNIGVYIILAFISGFALLFWNLKHGSRVNYSSLSNGSSSSVGVSSSALNDPASSNNSIKLSNFLKVQDSDQVSNSPLPVYTFTQQKGQDNSFNAAKFWALLKRWNIIDFLKHCSILGIFVVSLYYIGFQCTL